MINRVRDAAPAGVDRFSVRFVDERTDELAVRDGQVEPPRNNVDRGAMVTVVAGGGLGYAATPDTTASGLRRAAQEAKGWAERTASVSVADFSAVPWPGLTGSTHYATPIARAWEDVPLNEKLDVLLGEVAAMETDPRVVERTSSLLRVRAESHLVDADGSVAHQVLDHIAPDSRCVVHADGVTQHRGFGARGVCQQGGFEILQRVGFIGAGSRLTEEALQLLLAPQCPTGTMDLVLAPDQMMLQIHESIGHPLELDRILGDERNYAGTSFVTQDMFGSYRYGSDLLDVTFDPTVPHQFASYGFDAEGEPASKAHVIRKGILERPLGSALSQFRAGLPGVANARASSWNRPPIDRMANLNVEPGSSSFEELIAGVERGVFMATNISWSIDDSRNKFQFGCEYGRLIESGRLTSVVRNPNYRGVSATFWRSLSGVGNAATVEVLGTPYCGKGEPNQVIRVGHASPTCRFADIDVFGGH